MTTQDERARGEPTAGAGTNPATPDGVPGDGTGRNAGGAGRGTTGRQRSWSVRRRMVLRALPDHADTAPEPRSPRPPVPDPGRVADRGPDPAPAVAEIRPSGVDGDDEDAPGTAGASTATGGDGRGASTAGDGRGASTATGRDGHRTTGADRADRDRPERAGTTAATTRLRWIGAVLCALLLATLVPGVLAGRDWYRQGRVDRAHQQALAAARQFTVTFMSLSAATVDRDLDRIASGATGDFKDEFTRDTAQVKAAVVQNRVQSRGTVLRAGLVSGDERTAVVLVAMDATVRNAGAPDGRLSHYRVRVTLSNDRRTGRWLVSQLQFVG